MSRSVSPSQSIRRKVDSNPTNYKAREPTTSKTKQNLANCRSLTTCNALGIHRSPRTCAFSFARLCLKRGSVQAGDTLHLYKRTSIRAAETLRNMVRWSFLPSASGKGLIGKGYLRFGQNSAGSSQKPTSSGQGPCGPSIPKISSNPTFATLQFHEQPMTFDITCLCHCFFVSGTPFWGCSIWFTPGNTWLTLEVEQTYKF